MRDGSFSEDFCLDFASTLEWRYTRRLDGFATEEALASWFADRGFAIELGPVGADGLARAHALRDATYGLGLHSVLNKPFAAEDVETVNRFAGEPPLATALTSLGGVEHSGHLTALLSSIARASIEIFASPSRQMIRQCEATECTRLFLDRSHGASRRWCGMQPCGNRMKAATYRSRKRRGGVT